MKKTSPLRFLFLARQQFPPRHVDVSILFGKEMSQRGHHIDFLLQSEKPCKKSHIAKWNGNRVYVGPTDTGTSIVGRTKRHVLNFLNDMKVFKLAAGTSYDFIQVKDKFLAGVAALIAAKFNKTRYYFWLSYPFPEANLHAVQTRIAPHPVLSYARGRLYGFLLYKIIIPQADHVFVQSEQMKKEIVAKGFPEWKLTPVPMGVSLESVPSASCRGIQYEDRSGEKSVVYLGTFIRARRMDFLIRAFAEVVRKEPDSVLCMIGEGSDSSDTAVLKELASDLGIGDKVRFTGFLPIRDAWEYVGKASVCVSPIFPTPILDVGSPTKLVEYMAMGKAVVANDHPEQSLIIRESGAGLCVPYETGAFADAIVKILRDPESARLMGRRGREYVERKRSYKKIADAVEQKYNLLMRPARQNSVGNR